MSLNNSHLETLRGAEKFCKEQQTEKHATETLVADQGATVETSSAGGGESSPVGGNTGSQNDSPRSTTTGATAQVRANGTVVLTSPAQVKHVVTCSQGNTQTIAVPQAGGGVSIVNVAIPNQPVIQSVIQPGPNQQSVIQAPGGATLQSVQLPKNVILVNKLTGQGSMIHSTDGEASIHPVPERCTPRNNPTPRPLGKTCPPVSRVFSYRPFIPDLKALPSKSYDEHIHLSYFEDHFDVVCKLGSGSFAEVFKVKSKEDGKYYAVKRSKEKFKGKYDRQRKYEEVQKHEKLQKPVNCIKFYNAWEENEHLYIQTELCKSSLLQYAEENRSIPDYVIWNVLIDLLQALKYLHDRNLVHLDIKPDNIFLSEKWIWKLGNFGFVLNLSKHEEPEVIESDMRYAAIEVLEGQFYKAADIFSLGITILELACDLDLPASGPLWHQLRKGNIPQDFLSGITPDLTEVICLMMEPDPNKRPEVDQILRKKTVSQAMNSWKRCLQGNPWLSYFLLIYEGVLNFLYYMKTSLLLPYQIIIKEKSITLGGEQNSALLLWQHEHGRNWISYAPEEVVIMNNAFNKQQNTVTLYSYSETQQIIVNFDDMLQTHQLSGWEQRIRCCVLDDQTFYVWQWKDDYSCSNYNPKITLELEKQYKTGTKKISVRFNEKDYEINLKYMSQINITTGKNHRVMRLKVALNEPPKSFLQTASGLKLQEKKNSVHENDTDGEINPKKLLSDRMKSCFLKISSRRLYRKNLAKQSLDVEVKLATSHWLDMICADNSSYSHVMQYLSEVKEISSVLLHWVINIEDVYGNTALHLSLITQKIGVLEALLNSGLCDVNRKNKAGFTGSMLICASSIENDYHRNMIIQLLKLSDLSERTYLNAETALIVATSQGSLEAVELLLEAGADVNMADFDQSTALMYAADMGYFSIAKSLCSHPQCDLTLKDKNGMDAYDIAVSAGHGNIALMLDYKKSVSHKSSKVFNVG